MILKLFNNIKAEISAKKDFKFSNKNDFKTQRNETASESPPNKMYTIKMTEKRVTKTGLLRIVILLNN